MNKIKLEQVCPIYLEAEKIKNSEVWNKGLNFISGEKIQIVAPSGQGKTSFIHFLYGLRKDYTGNIIMDETPINQMDEEAIAKLRSLHLSIQFQDLRLFNEHTGHENIVVKKDLEPFENTVSVREMARHLGVENKLNQPIQVCSYGEQQRIALIRCLQQPFNFLLLDEPFGHLDEKNREKAMELILQQVTERKAAVILADLQVIPYFKADKILHL